MVNKMAELVFHFAVFCVSGAVLGVALNPLFVAVAFENVGRWPFTLWAGVSAVSGWFAWHAAVAAFGVS